MRLSSLMLRSAVEVVDLLRVLTTSTFDVATDAVAASSTGSVADTVLSDVTLWGRVLLRDVTLWGTVSSVTPWPGITASWCCFNK